MAHVEPLDAAQLPELRGVLEGARAAMGFVPDSMLTMAHLPQLPAAFSLLAGVVFGADLRERLPPAARDALPAPGNQADNLTADLIQLVAYAASVAAGCRYCQAHTAHNAHRFGVADDKLEALLDYQASPAFSAAEKCALDLAFAAARVPNEADAGHFEALRRHFSERQIVQLVAVVALFGFLNRWNDTLATALEPLPREFADAHLAAGGWQVDKHASSGVAS